MLRFVYNVIIISALFISPWWFIAVLFLFGVIFFRIGIELLVWGSIIDIVWGGTFAEVEFTSLPLWTLISGGLVLVSLALKQKLRTFIR